MKRAIARTAEEMHAYRANITLAILAGCVLAAAFYAVSLYSLISHTVALRQIEGSITAVSSEIAGLDSQYLALSSAVTPDMLAAHGFSAGQVSLYITRSAPTASIPALAQGGHEL